VALVLLSAGAWALVDADARAIRLGMTRDEVEARMGVPFFHFPSTARQKFGWTKMERTPS
jgi:hypothetical protein